MDNTIEEYWDLVDEDDNVIGKIARSDPKSKDISNHRVVNLFIVNSKGELWIPRRTANKRIYPSCLDMSMGGHVESGESYKVGLKRETEEELKINTDEKEVRLLGKLTPHEDGVSSFMEVYEIKSDEAPNYNPDDYTEYFWLTPKDLLKRIEEGEKVKGDLPKLVKKFYL